MRQCSLCGKGSIIRGVRRKLRGNYNPTAQKRKYPNLQRVRLSPGTRALICTSCIKTLAKSGKRSVV